MNGLIRIAAVFGLVASLIACNAAPKDETVNWSARKLYNEATRSLSAGDFSQAVEYFEILESRFPFGRYTLQAQLDIAYAHYKRGEHDIAIDACDRFMKLHPRNEHIDYAMYLKGLANFTRGSGLFANFTGRDLSEYDPQALANSFGDFDTLVRRFPDSRYTPDARQRMVFLRNELAEHELKTADFYYSRGAMIATINRVKYMLENYDGANSIPDGLALMAQAYSNMGLEDLAEDTLRVLASNSPEHPALNSN
ncbi:MAG: outer membrane protein assembly factor BamD [Pseudomonadota bacterium]